MDSFSQKREKLLSKTREDIANAVNQDILIIQALNTIDDLTTQLNGLSKRLREWHAYTLPELDKAVSDHEDYARLVASKTREELMSEFVKGTPMGAELEETDYIAVQSLAKQIVDLNQFKKSLLIYLEARLKKLMPNTSTLVGPLIAARLLAGAGSLRKLAMLPASTLQLLGAEKALFRHLKTGAKSPKHGYIINHPLIQKAKAVEKGKIARVIGDKLALCAKVDYFGGEFIADEYLAKLEARFQ